MGFFNPNWSRIHGDETFGPWSIPLSAFSLPYAAGSRLRSLAYEKGFIKRKNLPGFVVSIGNLTVGGTGKTPATSMLAAWTHKKGYRGAVLSRGYGGKYEDKVLVVSDGEQILTDSLQSGDEPFLLAKKIPEVPLILSRKRVDAGLFAHEKYGCDFFILDDGFQHFELQRDLDIVLMDAEKPFGNGHLLPRGPLRESVAHLKRADAFVLTRAHSGGQKTQDFLQQRFPEIPVFCADHIPDRIVFPCTDEFRDPSSIKGVPILAFSGIAHPEFFLATLKGLGARIVFFKGFKDHYPYTEDDLRKLLLSAKNAGARYVLTTEKDWMRILHLKVMFPEMGYLGIAFKLLSGYDDFFGMVEERIRQVI